MQYKPGLFIPHENDQCILHFLELIVYKMSCSLYCHTLLKVKSITELSDWLFMYGGCTTSSVFVTSKQFGLLSSVDYGCLWCVKELNKNTCTSTLCINIYVNFKCSLFNCIAFIVEDCIIFKIQFDYFSSFCLSLFLCLCLPIPLRCLLMWFSAHLYFISYILHF